MICAIVVSMPFAVFSGDNDDRLTEALKTTRMLASLPISGNLQTKLVRNCFVAVSDLIELSPEGNEGEVLRDIAKNLEPLCQRGPNSRLEQLGLLYLLGRADSYIDLDGHAERDETADLPAGELETLKLAVAECWNVGALSSEALRTVVTVSFAINRDGTPRADTIRQVSANGGGEAATRQLFESVRRAIIRCGARGMDVFPGMYELTFDASSMRIR